MNLRQKFAALCEDIALRDEQLFVVLGDIGHGIFKSYREKFKDRYLNIGILEQSMVSFGAGLSRIGFHPILHTIAPFMLERAFEQIKLDFSYHSLAGNLVFVGGTFDYSNLGVSHHCYTDLATAKSIENSEFFSCGSCQELEFTLNSCYKNRLLSFYRINSAEHNENWSEEELINGYGTLGEARSSSVVITHTGMLSEVLQAIPQLKRRSGESVKIIAMIKQHPIPSNELIAELRGVRRIFVVEDHFRVGSMADEFMRIGLAIGAQVKELNLGTSFIREYGSLNDLRRIAGIDASQIALFLND